VPIILGEAAAALAAAPHLEACGLLAVPSRRRPSRPAARLRLAFSAGHTEPQVDQLIAAVRPQSARARQGWPTTPSDKAGHAMDLRQR